MDPADSTPGAESRVDDQLRKAARWAQRLSAPRTGAPLPALAPDEPGGSRWAGLAGALERYAADVSGMPGAGSAIDVLRGLYGVEDAQSAMLATIERDVKLLSEGPFKSGQLLLSEAQRVGTQDPEYPQFLQQARDHFYDAHGLASSIQERALVEFHLGAVYALEGRRSDAEYWLGQSHESARQVIAELGAAAKNVKVLHSRGTAAALTYLYPAGMFVIPAKLKKVWSAERASGALEAFLPFLDCVTRAFNSISSDKQLPALKLEKTGEGTYALDVSPPSPERSRAPT
jgi:hypothetical protein